MRIGLSVPTEDMQGRCLVQRPASQGLSQCLLHKKSPNCI